MKRWLRFSVVVGILSFVICGAEPTLSQNTVAPPVVYLKVPGHPFTAVPSQDGQWVFASLTAPGTPGLAVLHREGTAWVVKRVVPLKQGAAGLALSRDEKTLIAAAGEYVFAFDVEKLVSSAVEATIGKCFDRHAGAVYVVITSDDRYAFVSNEWTASVSVFELSKVREKGLSNANLIGKISVGNNPVGLALSPDGRFLYSTSEIAPAAYGFPKQASSASAAVTPEGVLAVIDVRLAETDPANAVVRRVPAGSEPVRVVLSPSADKAYVSVRGADAVDVFSTAALLSSEKQALVAKVPVGHAPVGLALSNDGLRLFVVNSNRFAGGDAPQTLSVLDTTKLGAGLTATIGSISAGSFPREAHLTADGRTLIVTNYNSDSVEFIDVTSFLPPKG